MSVTLRSIIIAGCLMIVAALLYRYSNIQGQISSEELQARFPTFTAKDFSGQVFDTDGIIQYSVNAQEMTYYQDKDLINLVKPIGYYFDHHSVRKSNTAALVNMKNMNDAEALADKKALATTQNGTNQSLINIVSEKSNTKLDLSPFNYWTILADSGQIVHNQLAVLDGQVTVFPSSQEELIQKITTPYMKFDMKSNTISSEKEITIQGQRFIDYGRNYELDLNAKTFVIKEKPHAVYFP